MPMEKLKKFIFTFGAPERHPYHDGWVDVIAPNIDLARKTFLHKYPLQDGLMCCLGIYREEDFRATDMYTNGNYGKYWHETLVYDEAVI